MSIARAYMGDPADLTDRFNTPLTPEEEAQFQAWMRSLPERLRSTSDYDMRGAWKADAKAATNGHLPDTWKKPNHPTFSNESIYSTSGNQGGQWSSADDKNWLYWASPANLTYRSAPSLLDYFRRVEPDSTVILPSNYRMPSGK